MENFLVCFRDGCSSFARTDGLCPRHYEQKRKGFEDLASDYSNMPPCSVSHCTNPANSRAVGSYCDPHYQIAYRNKNPEDKTLDGNWAACAIDGCPKKAVHYKMCSRHAARCKQGKIPAPDGVEVKLNPICKFPECINRCESRKNGLCHSHACQVFEGKELTPLRGWGKYTKGLEMCVIKDCRGIAFSTGLCSKHKGSQMTYRISVEELQELCAIKQCQNPGCKETRRLHIDHDHETGKVRGILCMGCNTTLGRMRDDRVKIRGLAAYLDAHLAG